jgi:tetratricopeptide (TPR) repeat protein
MTQTLPACEPACSLQTAREALLAGNTSRARRQCRVLLRVDPGRADAIHILAMASASDGRPAEAAALLKKALKLEECHPVWWRDLGMISAAQEDWEGAAGAFEKAAVGGASGPGSVSLHARALLRLGQLGDAEKVLSRSPDGGAALASAYELLAGAYRRSQRFDDELRIQHLLLVLRGESAQAWAAIGNAQWACGLGGECLLSFRKGLALDPKCSQLHSWMLTVLLHDASQTRSSLLSEHRDWDRMHSPQPIAPAGKSVAAPPGKLRIAYLTGEFKFTPAFHFLFPILEEHDLQRFEIFFYHAADCDDEYTGEYRRIATHWRDVHGRSTGEIRELLAADGIQILVDLSGHFRSGRLDVFATRAAPVQVAIPNYPATTGLSAIDYIITDWWTCPAGQESQYAEKPARLTTWYMPFKPPAAAPDPTPLPALANGVVTFGMLQRPAKLNPGVLDALAEILRRTSGSRLLIHYAWRSLDYPSDASRGRLLGELVARGISADRIFFRGALCLHDHLGLLCNLDIGLDTFPYNGQTTTCDCLWTGVPVVTVAGESHVSRVGCALLHYAGLDDWVASDAAEYIEIAVRKARDIAGLQELRRTLRARLRSSPLLDAVRVTREIESLYLGMWQDWRDTPR